MMVDADCREVVLIRMGANRIAEIRDDEGRLKGFDVSPDIDMAGYDDAQADLLAGDKDRARDSINQKAEQARAAIITCLPGQAIVYAAKLDEARRACATKSPSQDDYPLLAATIGIDGNTIGAVAKTVIARFEACNAQLAEVEKIRKLALKIISSATSGSEIDKAISSINWTV